VVEHIDNGGSGARERRPALDRVLAGARKRRLDVLVVWRLDRLGRSLQHGVMTLEGLQHLGIGFVSLNEAINVLTPAGRLQMHLLAAIAKFERGRLVERVKAGQERVAWTIIPPADRMTGECAWTISKSRTFIRPIGRRHAREHRD
jgi:DNA invertase Pin-like site-specific DNA recombinase